MNVAMIVAGGVGRRFGGDTPKQFVEVLGRPVLAYTLENFERSPLIDAIAVVCRRECADRVRGIAGAWGISKLRWLPEAGETCPDSIRSGVRALRGDMADDDLLMMHMAVSPMLTQAAIAEGIAVCRDRGCSFAAYPVNICMGRRADGDWVDEAVYKEDFVELNAPWTFRYGDAFELYRRADELGLGRDPRDYTVNLWIAMGNCAYTYRGCDEGRLKITTRHDLRVFEALLTARNREENGDAICDER